MRSVKFGLLALAFATVVGSATVLAQTTQGLTEDEIAKLFVKHLTRGLKIFPSDGSTPSGLVDVLPDEDQVNIAISFDFDSSALRADQKPLLIELCKAMKTADVRLFQIIGHTDSIGSASYNETLSRLRAEEVKRHLEADCGIPPSVLSLTFATCFHGFHRVHSVRGVRG